MTAASALRTFRLTLAGRCPTCGQGVTAARVVPPLCGECDERWIETPDGLAKCPRCYPRAQEAS